MTDTEARRTGPRRWRGQEPEDRRAARRTQLIEAGLQIMGTEGAAAATMRATCREAALTERYFYESFANRDELLVAVLDEVVLGARDTILDALEAAPSEPSALIRHVVKAFTNYVFKDPRRGRIMFVESQAEPALWDRGRELMAEFTNPISASLELMYGGEATDSANSELNSVGGLFGALAFIYQAHTPVLQDLSKAFGGAHFAHGRGAGDGQQHAREKRMTSASATGGRRLGPEDRREQIIVSAAKVFEEKSFADVSMTELAKAAGVGRPLLNHYFGSKRELYLDVVRRFVFIPEVAVDRIPRSASQEKRIGAVIDRWLDVAWRHRDMWISTVMSDDLRRDPEMDRILQDADDVAARRMMDALEIRPSEGSEAAVHSMIVAYGGLAKAASKQCW